MPSLIVQLNKNKPSPFRVHIFAIHVQNSNFSYLSGRQSLLPWDMQSARIMQTHKAKPVRWLLPPVIRVTHLAFSTPHSARTASWFLEACLHNPANNSFLIAKWQIATSTPMTSYQHQHSGAKFKENINHICWFILVHILSGVFGDA